MYKISKTVNICGNKKLKRAQIKSTFTVDEVIDGKITKVSITNPRFLIWRPSKDGKFFIRVYSKIRQSNES